MNVAVNVSVRDVALATGFAFAAGLLLWPPGHLYWSEVAGEFGAGATLALVGALGVGAGAIFELLGDVGVGNFAVGTLVGLAGLVTIAALSAPDVVAYAGWYVLLGACLVVGVASVVVYRRGEVELYPVNWA